MADGQVRGTNLEGAVHIGMRKQFEAIENPADRVEMARAMIAEAYARGKAINMASLLEIDAVIDLAETRSWILRGLRSVPRSAREGRRRFIDTW